MYFKTKLDLVGILIKKMLGRWWSEVTKSGVQEFNTDLYLAFYLSKCFIVFPQITGVMKKIVSDIIGTEKCVVV